MDGWLDGVKWDGTGYRVEWMDTWGIARISGTSFRPALCCSKVKAGQSEWRYRDDMHIGGCLVQRGTLRTDNGNVTMGAIRRGNLLTI